MSELKTYFLVGGATLVLAGLAGFLYRPKSSTKKSKKSKSKSMIEKKEKKKASNPEHDRFLRVVTETHAPCLRIIDQIRRLTSNNNSLPITSAELCQELLLKWKDLKSKHTEALSKVNMTQAEYTKLYKKYSRDPEIGAQLEPVEYFKIVLETFTMIPVEGLDEDWLWTLDLKVQQPEQASALNPVKARNLLLDIIRLMSEKFDEIVEQVKKENGLKGEEGKGVKFSPAQQQEIQSRWSEAIEKGKHDLLTSNQVDEKSFEYAIQGYRKLIPDMFNITKKAQNQLGLKMKQILHG